VLEGRWEDAASVWVSSMPDRRVVEVREDEAREMETKDSGEWERASSHPSALSYGRFGSNAIGMLVWRAVRSTREGTREQKQSSCPLLWSFV
jgi:hypothetical protein